MGDRGGEVRVVRGAFAFAFALALSGSGGVVGAQEAGGVPVVESGSAEAPVACIPDCRDGYVCVQGQCTSACNPPCPSGQSCSGAGQCVVPVEAAPTAPGTQGAQGAPGAWQQPAVAPPPTWQQPTPTPATRPPRVDKARRRAVLGLVMAGIAGGLAAAAAVTTNEDDRIPALPLGGAATALFIVNGPIVARGSGFARTHPEVRGLRGLRIFGWISYGLTSVGAVSLVALGVNGVYVPPPPIGVLGLLGVVSLVSFSIDALSAAGQARALNVTASAPPRVRWAPGISLRRDPDQQLRPTIGVVGAF